MNTPHNASIINEILVFHIRARCLHYLKTLSVVHVVILVCCVLLGCCFVVSNVVSVIVCACYCMLLVKTKVYFGRTT